MCSCGARGGYLSAAAGGNGGKWGCPRKAPLQRTYVLPGWCHALGQPVQQDALHAHVCGCRSCICVPRCAGRLLLSQQGWVGHFSSKFASECSMPAAATPPFSSCKVVLLLMVVVVVGEQPLLRGRGCGQVNAATAAPVAAATAFRRDRAKRDDNTAQTFVVGRVCGGRNDGACGRA